MTAGWAGKPESKHHLKEAVMVLRLVVVTTSVLTAGCSVDRHPRSGVSLEDALLAYPTAADSSTSYVGELGVRVALQDTTADQFDATALGYALAANVTLVAWPTFHPVPAQVDVVVPSVQADYYTSDLEVRLTPTQTLQSSQWYAIKVAAFPGGVVAGNSWHQLSGAWYARFIRTSLPLARAVAFCDSEDPVGLSEVRVFFTEGITTTVPIEQAVVIRQAGTPVPCTGGRTIGAGDYTSDFLLKCPSLAPAAPSTVEVVAGTVKSYTAVAVPALSQSFTLSALPRDLESDCARLELP